MAFANNYSNSSDGSADHMSEYIEMGYLAVFLVIGGPLNLTALTRLNEMRKQRVYTRLLYLKVHLNITDLMVLLIYVTSKLCWLITFDWRGGDALCPIIHFAQYLAFAISSNVVVCIAVDRALTVFCKRYYTGSTSHRNLKILLLIAWVTAAVSSLPQLWVWTVITLPPSAGQTKLHKQCTTVWSIRRYLENKQLNETQYVSEKIYNAAHLLIIFWIPCLIVIVCYLLIFIWLCTNNPDAVDNRRDSPPNPSRSYYTMSAAPTSHNPPSSVIVQLENGVSTHVTQSTLQHPSASRASLDPNTFKQTRRKVLKLTIVLVGAYILFWLPYNTMGLLMFFNVKNASEINKKYYFLYSFVVLNSVINPLLYGAVTCPSAKNVIKCLLTRRTRRRRQSIKDYAGPE